MRGAASSQPVRHRRRQRPRPGRRHATPTLKACMHVRHTLPSVGSGDHAAG
jgi:hypothetical protein